MRVFMAAALFFLIFVAVGMGANLPNAFNMTDKMVMMLAGLVISAGVVAVVLK